MKPLLIVFLLATQALTQDLNSTLHSTLYGIQFAFVDEMVEFTCVVGSSSMVWTSDEYIGPGQTLIILLDDPAGQPTSAVRNPQTTAERIDSSTNEIVTRLRIRVASNYPIASVQCRDSNANTVVSVTFRLAGAALIQCDRVAVCPGEILTCACTTGGSNSLAWMTNGNTLTFFSNNSLPMRKDVSGSSTFAVLTENSDTNGVRVIMSNITVRAPISSSDLEIILTCENVDRSVIEPIILRGTNNSCPMIQPSDQVTTLPGNEAQRESCSGPIAAAVVPVVVVLILLIVIIAAVVVILYLTRYKSLEKQLEDKILECAKKISKEDSENALRELEKTKNDEKEQALRVLKDKMNKDKDKEIKDLKIKMNNEKDQALHELKDEMNGDKDKEIEDLKLEMNDKKEQALQELEGKKNREKETEIAKLRTQMENEKKTALKEMEERMCPKPSIAHGGTGAGSVNTRGNRNMGGIGSKNSLQTNTQTTKLTSTELPMMGQRKVASLERRATFPTIEKTNTFQDQ